MVTFVVLNESSLWMEVVLAACDHVRAAYSKTGLTNALYIIRSLFLL